MVGDTRQRGILLTMALLGLRRSEVLGLNVGDVDLATARLHVRHAKGGKSRVLPIPSELRPTLREHLGAEQRGADEPLFLGAHGRRLSRSALARLFSKWLDDAGLADQGLTPHSARHGAATRWLKAGLSVRHVQLLLGHSSLDVTSRYIHLTVDDIAAELENHVSALGHEDDEQAGADGHIPAEWARVLGRLSHEQRGALMAVARSMTADAEGAPTSHQRE